MTTGVAIQNPFTLFYAAQTMDWNEYIGHQFWNKNFTSDPGITNATSLKTIYSPSPSRYVEPKSAAFTGFTSTGGNTSTASQYNVSGSYNHGWNFYTDGWKTGGTIFFVALGYRDTYKNTSGTGNLFSVRNECYYWTNSSALNPDFGGRSFGANAALIYPQAAGITSYAFPIRPVKE